MEQTITINYTINGSELREFEFSFTGNYTNEDVKDAICDHHNSMLENEGGDDEGAVYTVDMIELDI